MVYSEEDWIEPIQDILIYSFSLDEFVLSQNYIGIFIHSQKNNALDNFSIEQHSAIKNN